MFPSLYQFTQQRLIHLRWLTVAGMFAAALISQSLLETSALVGTLCLYAGLVCAVNLLLLGASHFVHDGSLKKLVLSPAAQLCLDLAAWGGYVYLSGGASNPLISVFLPLVAIGAVVLTNRQAWALGIGSIVLYSFLWKFHVPIPMEMEVGMDHSHMHDSSSQHLLGMWIVFVVSAVVLLWFILRMSQEIRDRDAALIQAKEQAIRNDWLISMGSLAAGAAHEMSTPLATLNLLIDDWKEQPDGLPGRITSDVALMQKQIDICKRALTQLTQRAGHARHTTQADTQAHDWLKPLLDGWSSLHPHITLEQHIELDINVGPLAYDLALERALTNLLDNALHAGASHIQITASTVDQHLQLHIDDNGCGISQDALEAFEKFQPVESQGGLGIGLLLSRTTVEQLRGTLTLQKLPGVGSRATLTLNLLAQRGKP